MAAHNTIDQLYGTIQRTSGVAELWSALSHRGRSLNRFRGAEAMLITLARGTLPDAIGSKAAAHAPPRVRRDVIILGEH